MKGRVFILAGAFCISTLVAKPAVLDVPILTRSAKAQEVYQKHGGAMRFWVNDEEWDEVEDEVGGKLDELWLVSFTHKTLPVRALLSTAHLSPSSSFHLKNRQDQLTDLLRLDKGNKLLSLSMGKRVINEVIFDYIEGSYEEGGGDKRAFQACLYEDGARKNSVVIMLHFPLGKGKKYQALAESFMGGIELFPVKEKEVESE